MFLASAAAAAAAAAAASASAAAAAAAAASASAADVSTGSTAASGGAAASGDMPVGIHPLVSTSGMMSLKSRSAKLASPVSSSTTGYDRAMTPSAHERQPDGSAEKGSGVSERM